jgi:heat shock protein HspQ
MNSMDGKVTQFQWLSDALRSVANWYEGIIGGQTGIRTLGTFTRTTVFETAPFDHSGICPHVQLARSMPHKTARQLGRARPLADDFGFAKRKVETCRARGNICCMSANPEMPITAEASYAIGDVVRHRVFDFRGVVFDIDPVFANSEEWYQSIPESVRPRKDQPFYHLFAENADSSYIAYVSQQNLLLDADHGPVNHPAIEGYFEDWRGKRYELKRTMRQ